MQLAPLQVNSGDYHGMATAPAPVAAALLQQLFAGYDSESLSAGGLQQLLEAHAALGEGSKREAQQGLLAAGPESSRPVARQVMGATTPAGDPSRPVAGLDHARPGRGTGRWPGDPRVAGVAQEPERLIVEGDSGPVGSGDLVSMSLV